MSPDRVARGLPTGGRGSKVYVLCAEPKEHKHFRPGTRPGGSGNPAGRIGDRGDRQIVYVPNVYVPFPAATFSEPLLRTLLRTLFIVEPTSGPLLRTLPQNPSQNLLRTLILERCVAVRPLRRTPRIQQTEL